MEHRTGVGEAEQPPRGGGSCKIDLVPGMAGQVPDFPDLDPVEAERFGRIVRCEQLPFGLPKRGGRLVRDQQCIDRLDHFGGIALNAGQALREKAAIDEELQVATAKSRGVCRVQGRCPIGSR